MPLGHVRLEQARLGDGCLKQRAKTNIVTTIPDGLGDLAAQRLDGVLHRCIGLDWRRLGPHGPTQRWRIHRYRRRDWHGRRLRYGEVPRLDSLALQADRTAEACGAKGYVQRVLTGADGSGDLFVATL